MEVRLGNIFGFSGGNYAGNVYDKDFLAPTLNTMQGGCKQPMIIANINPSGNGINGAVHTVDAEAPTVTTNKGEGNKIIVAMRGRNPENPSDRTVGAPTEQRLEPNSQGICNTLTSVTKDNLVMEKVVIDDTYANRQPRVYEDYSPALRSEREGLKTIEVKQLGFMDNGTGKHQSNTVYDEKGLCPNITTIEGGGTQQIKVMTENVYDFYNNNLKSDGVYGTLTSACSHNGSGTFGVIESQNVYLSDKGKKYVCDPKRGMCTDINADVCQTLTAKGQSNWTGSFVSEDIERLEKSATIGSDEPTIIHLKNGEKITSNDDLAQYRIRKLTPLECWSLMNFSEEDFLSAKLGSREVAKEILETYPHLGRRAFTEIERLEKMSNTQLYKQAGNSIVKNVLVAIIGQMIPGKEEVYKNI